MADTTGGAGGTGGGQGGPILSNLTPSILAQTTALKTNAEVLAQNQSLLGNVGLAEDEAAQKTSKFSEALKKQALQSAQALSVTNQLTGALTNYMGKLTQAASLGQHYSRMLKEVDDAQKLYIGSLNFSTKSIGDASTKLQNHITVMNRMKVASLATAREFKMSVEETDKFYSEMMNRFGRQIMASTDAMGQLKEASKAALVTARSSGLDAGKAAEFMAQRFHGSRKNTTELTKDMKTLAVTVNSYKESLKTLSKDAMNQSLLQADEFVQVLGELSKAFEHGPANIKLFGDVLGGFSKALAQAGVNTNAVKRDMAAAVKYFGDLNRPDLKNFVGTTVAMQVSQSGGEGVIVDPKIQAKLKSEMERAASRGVDELTKAQMAGEIAQEDVGYQRALAKKEVAVKPATIRRREMIDQYGMGARSADRFVELQEKIANKTDEELKQGDADTKEYQKLVKGMKEGSTPEKQAYKAVVQIRDTLQTLHRYVTQSLGIALAAAVGGSLVTSLVAKSAATKALAVGGGPMAMLGRVGTMIPGMGAAAGGGGLMAGAAAAAGPAAAITAIIITIKHVIDRHGKEIWAKVKGIGDLIWSGLKPIVQTLGLAFKIVSDALKPVADIIGKVIKVGLDLITFALKPVIEAVKKVMSVVLPVVYVIGKVLVPVMNLLGKAISPLITVIKYTLIPVFWALSLPLKALGLLIDGLKIVFKGIYKELKPVIDTFKEAGVYLWKNFLQPVGKFFKDTYAKIEPVISWIGDKFKWLGDKLGWLWGPLSKFASVLGTAAKYGLMPLLLVLKTIVPVAKIVANVFGTVGGIIYKYFINPIRRAGQAIVDAATWIYNKTIGRFKKTSATSGIESGMEGAETKLKQEIEEKEAAGEDASDLKEQLSTLQSSKKGAATNEDIAAKWNVNRQALIEQGTTSVAATGATIGLQQQRGASMAAAAKAGQVDQKLIIEQGEGGGESDSEFKSDPTTGDIRMKIPGSYITIRKDEFKQSVAGVVTESLTKGT